MSAIGGSTSCQSSTGVAALNRALQEQRATNERDKTKEAGAPAPNPLTSTPPTAGAVGSLVNEFA